MSGSIVGVHSSDGNNHLVFTRTTGDTLAVVDLPNLSGVSFSGSMPTNSRGLTVTDLSSYQDNLLSVNTNGLPNNVELLTTTHHVLPSEGAIIYKRFNYVTTRTYIFQITAKNGFVVPFGTRVTTPSGQLVGYTQDHGILIAHVIGRTNKLIVDSEKLITIDLSRYKPNVDSVQEVKNV